MDAALPGTKSPTGAVIFVGGGEASVGGALCGVVISQPESLVVIVWYFFFFVTHDQDEAFELADRVAVFNEGRIQQVGAPAELRDNPKNDFVREFLEV